MQRLTGRVATRVYVETEQAETAALRLFPYLRFLHRRDLAMDDQGHRRGKMAVWTIRLDCQIDPQHTYVCCGPASAMISWDSVRQAWQMFTP